jgi:hypothetical protein
MTISIGRVVVHRAVGRRASPPARLLHGQAYYADDYGLRKMTPAEYILDPRSHWI